MDSTRLQDFLAFALDTYIRPSAISFPPRSRIHTSHSHSLLSIYPIYLSSPFALETIGNILVFFSVRCLLNQPSFSLSDSFIQLVPRKYIISYTHSIAITLIHHSSSSQFLFFLHTPRRIQDSKFCVYTYIHYIMHRRAVDSLLIPLPPSFSFFFSFLLIRLSFSILESLWIIEIVMSFCFLHQNKTVISAGKP